MIQPSDHKEDRLAVLVREGRGNPAKRPSFYRTFWRSDVYAVGTTEGEDGSMTDVQLSYFVVDGKVILPFFSSMELFEEVIPADHPCLLVSIEALFDQIPVDTVPVLNPTTDTEKEFSIGEVEALKEGLLFQMPPEPRMEEQEIRLSQPEKLPNELIEWLESFWKDNDLVKRAYLAMVHVPSREEPPYYLVGVQMITDCNSTLEEAMPFLKTEMRRELGERIRCDFFEIRSDNLHDISRYLMETTPVYERGLLEDSDE